MTQTSKTNKEKTACEKIGAHCNNGGIWDHTKKKCNCLVASGEVSKSKTKTTIEQNANKSALHNSVQSNQQKKDNATLKKKFGLSRNEGFRAMDPMDSHYQVVSYGENYSLVAFGLFAILMLLYKSVNNKL